MTVIAPYVYRATVLSVHDCDTLTARIDLGCCVSIEYSVRLLGCNARELAQPGGIEARDHLRSVLPVGAQFLLTSVHFDKWAGRIDGAITLADGADLVGQLIAGQWAAAWDGKGVKPVPPWPRSA